MRLWLAITMGKTTTCGFTMCDFYVRFFIIDQMRWVELRLDLDKKWTWFNIVNTVFEVQSEHISAYSELSSFPSIICACMGEQLVTLDLAAFWMFLCCWCWTHTLPLSPVQCWMWHDDSCWSSWVTHASRTSRIYDCCGYLCDLVKIQTSFLTTQSPSKPPHDTPRVFFSRCVAPNLPFWLPLKACLHVNLWLVR